MYFELLIGGGVRQALQQRKHHVLGQEMENCSMCSENDRKCRKLRLQSTSVTFAYSLSILYSLHGGNSISFGETYLFSVSTKKVDPPPGVRAVRACDHHSTNHYLPSPWIELIKLSNVPNYIPGILFSFHEVCSCKIDETLAFRRVSLDRVPTIEKGQHVYARWIFLCLKQSALPLFRYRRQPIPHLFSQFLCFLLLVSTRIILHG